jgi:hypothetical protein
MRTRPICVDKSSFVSAKSASSFTNFGHTFAAPAGGRHSAQTVKLPPAARVIGQPEKSHQILDVGGFDELQTAVLVKRDVRPGQLSFQEDAVMRGPKQDGLPPQIDARLAVFENLADDVLGLIGVVFAVD